VPVVVTRNDHHLEIQAPFAAKELCQGLPGRRWEPNRKVWRVPASAHCAQAVALAFSQWPDGLVVDDGTHALMEQAKAAIGARLRSALLDLPEVPVGKHPMPTYPHQRAAFWCFEAAPYAGLAIGMGGGKSRITVNLLDHWGADRVLVVTTVNGRLVWPAQFEQFSQRPWQVVNHGGLTRHGTERQNPNVRQRQEAAQAALESGRVLRRPTCIVVYWPLLKHMRGWLESIAWDAVVFDESHNAKKPGGVWSTVASRLADRAAHTVCLTGTLMPNGKMDAFAQTRLLDPGIFGTSFVAHRNEFAVMGGFENREVIGYRDAERHAELLAQAWYVASEEDMDLGLPEATHITRECVLGPSAAKAYAELEESLVAQLEDGVLTAANGLVRLLRLAQLTGGFAPILVPCADCEGAGRLGEARCEACSGAGEFHVGDRRVDDAKTELLAETLEGIDEPVVVFCRFRAHLKAVAEVAAKLGRTYGEVSGQGSCLTPDAKIPEGIQVLGVQIQAGSEAVDFTAARYAIFYSTGFDGGKYQQALKRTHRPGQTRHTIYIHLAARLPSGPSIDHVELAALERKDNVAQAVLDAMSACRP